MIPTGLPLLLALGLAATPASPDSAAREERAAPVRDDSAAVLANLAAAVGQRLGAAPARGPDARMAQWSNWSNWQNNNCNLGNWRNC